MTNIIKWTCPKCAGRNFNACKTCRRQKGMWQCVGCGFICAEEYLMGKPLPSIMKTFKCPSCGAGVGGIIPCKTCSQGNAFKCENCGYIGKAITFKPMEYTKPKPKTKCCGQK